MNDGDTLQPSAAFSRQRKAKGCFWVDCLATLELQGKAEESDRSPTDGQKCFCSSACLILILSSQILKGMGMNSPSDVKNGGCGCNGCPRESLEHLKRNNFTRVAVQGHKSQIVLAGGLARAGSANKVPVIAKAPPWSTEHLTGLGLRTAK